MQRVKKIMAGVAALAALAFGGAQIADATSNSNGDSGSDGGDQVVSGGAADQAKAAAIKAAGGGEAGAVRTENEGDAVYEVEVTNSGRVTEVQLDKDFGVVGRAADEPEGGDGDGETADDPVDATDRDGDGETADDRNDHRDEALTGATADKVTAAALDAVGGGTASDAHAESEGDAAYEVKVTYQGKTHEVQLDKTFNVVSQKLDESDD